MCIILYTVIDLNSDGVEFAEMDLNEELILLYFHFSCTPT